MTLHASGFRRTVPTFMRRTLQGYYGLPPHLVVVWAVLGVCAAVLDPIARYAVSASPVLALAFGLGVWAGLSRGATLAMFTGLVLDVMPGQASVIGTHAFGAAATACCAAACAGWLRTGPGGPIWTAVAMTVAGFGSVAVGGAASWAVAAVAALTQNQGLAYNSDALWLVVGTTVLVMVCAWPIRRVLLKLVRS